MLRDQLVVAGERTPLDLAVGPGPAASVAERAGALERDHGAVARE